MKESNIAELEPVINKLKKVETKLSKILSDNEGLFRNIVESILLLDKVNPATGYLIHREEIEELVRDEYSDLHSSEEYLERKNILHAIYELSNLVKGKHRLVVTALARAREEEGEEYYPQYREIIEKKIIEIFYPGDFEVSNNYHNSELIGKIE